MNNKRAKALCVILAAAFLSGSCGGNETVRAETTGAISTVISEAETTSEPEAEESATESSVTEEDEPEAAETEETTDNMIYAYADIDETGAEETEAEAAEETVIAAEESAETTTSETKIAIVSEPTDETTAEATAPVTEAKTEQPKSEVTAAVTVGTKAEDTSKKNDMFISVLGPNTLYVGDSFEYKYYIGNKGSKRVSAFWEFKGDAAEFEKNGKMTAVKKGDVELTITDVSDGLSATLVIHCIESADDVTEVVKVNGIPIANKTYPVPKNYNPGGLTAETQKAYNELVAGAARDGIAITFISGFRSYNEQVQVYNRWKEKYGSGADRVSARPGHSEHQLGLAIDVNSIWMEFADTPEAKWLAAHCHEYGFILRYPSYAAESITGYAYEPWHIRYLGKNTAAMVHETGLTLEECLGIDSYYRD